MTSILESVEWGKPALALLAQCNELDTELPAVMHIRHTERPNATPEDMERARRTGRSHILSTEKGKEAAYEFGTRLTLDRTYRFYHTPVDRTKETAEKIHEALLERGASSTFNGVMSSQTMGDRNKRLEYIIRDRILDGSYANPRPVLIKWVAGGYPPWEIEPSLMFAQRVSMETMNNLASAQSGMDVYVSHDMWIGMLLMHWFGIVPDEDNVKFLDGFILQLKPENMHVYTKDGKKETYYPYWWNF